MQSLLVKDYMAEDYKAITASMNVSQAVYILLANNITGAPVTDSSLHIIGFISETDCISHIINSSYYCDEPPSVKDIMTKQVITVGPDNSILEVAEMMVRSAHKVYPVCENQKLIGVIRRHNVLTALLDKQVDCFAHI